MAAKKKGLAILLGLGPGKGGEDATEDEAGVSEEMRVAGQNLLDAIAQGDPDGAAQAVRDIADMV
jgi:hypothetical protein